MMTDGSEQARFAQYRSVLAAAHKAADGRQLRIQTQPELFGASIIGPLVEAYVMPARCSAEHGWQDLRRAWGGWAVGGDFGARGHT